MTWERTYPVLLLLGCLCLSVVPLPPNIASLEPDWVAVMLIYFSVTRPGRFGLLTSLALGLVLDVLSGALLGQNALALITLCYLTQRFHLRIRAFPASQIVGTGFALLALYQFMLFWIDGVVGRDVPAIGRMSAVLAGTILLAVGLALRGHDRPATRTRIEA